MRVTWSRSSGISVVICTQDRTDMLRRCLSAIRALDYPDYEVIVADNAPQTEATRDLVGELGGIRYVREDTPGLDWARNRGIAEARNPIVALIAEKRVKQVTPTQAATTRTNTACISSWSSPPP